MLPKEILKIYMQCGAFLSVFGHYIIMTEILYFSCKTYTFAAEADISDVPFSGNVKEIVKTLSYNWKNVHVQLFSGKTLRKLNNSLRLRALYGIILRVTFPEKVREVL